MGGGGGGRGNRGEEGGLCSLGSLSLVTAKGLVVGQSFDSDETGLEFPKGPSSSRCERDRSEGAACGRGQEARWVRGWGAEGLPAFVHLSAVCPLPFTLAGRSGLGWARWMCPWDR